MPDPTPMPRPTTPEGEAVEQAIDGLSMCCRDVAGVIQTDVDRMAAGDYRLADLATVGFRLLHVGVNNAIRMAGVLSDNLALLTAEESREEKVVPAERRVNVIVPIPAGQAVTITSSSLRGRTKGQWLPRSRITIARSTFTAGTNSPVQVEVLVNHTGAPRDIYEGALSVMVGDRRESTVDYLVAVDRTL